jgi:hypothetical protein
VSVLVTIRVSGDVAAFRRMLEEEPDRFTAISDRGKAAGAIHHQFGVGDGFVLVVDEWTSAAAFEQFFQDPDIGAIMAEANAGQPEVTIAEAIDSPDRF